MIPIRGILGSEIGPETALAMGRAIAAAVGGTVAVGTDGGRTSQAIRAGVVAGIVGSGVNVINLGILPMPVLRHYTETRPDVAAGVMISEIQETEDCGVRIVHPDGDERCEQAFRAVYSEASFVETGVTGEIVAEENPSEGYVETIVSAADSDAIRKAGIKLCVACGEACRPIVREVAEELGVSVLIADGGIDDTGTLGSTVVSVRADMGAAIVPDGTEAVFADSEGRTVDFDCPGNDGFLTMVKAIAVCAKNGGLRCEAPKPPGSFTVITDIECPEERISGLMTELKEDAERKGYRTEPGDGLRIFYEDGTVHLRATESTVRVYSESLSEEAAERRKDEIAEIVKPID